MTELMIISGLVLIICITSTKVLYKFGVPMLLIFIVLGMLFGSDGLVGIYFDNYEITSKLCSLGLVFIMFYGGFGTNWNAAREVAVPSILMSSLGVIMTATLTGLFCNNDIFHIILFMALFSVSIQWTLLPKFAMSLDLIDNDIDHSVLKTFTDYTGEINTDLLELMITEESEFIDIMIMDVGIPDDVLIVMIKRGDKILVPKGYTVIKKGDILVLSGNNIKELI